MNNTFKLGRSITQIVPFQVKKQVGDKVNLTVFRDNGIRERDLILGEMHAQPPQNGNGNNSEELYDECVRTAGKSFCDFLFRK
jgi:hypothetical protein